MRKPQATANVVVSIPLINIDGTQAAGLTLGTLSTKIIKPDGTALVGYTEATFTEPNSDGVYVCVFSTGAATKAFTLVDQSNPYQLTLDSSTLDVEPTTVPIWIVSQYPWETAKETTLTKETSKLFALTESQRGQHTGRGNMFYWNPVGGNDSNDGLYPWTAKLTWGGVNALVTEYQHDIIIAMPGNNGVSTVIDTTINLNKAYTLLRGPGRDWKFKPTISSADTVTISAIGCEVSGFIVETDIVGSKDAIKISADFAWVHNIWVDQSKGHGVAFENASHCLLEDFTIQDAASSGSGHAVSIKSTTGNAKRNIIRNFRIFHNEGHGVVFDGVNTMHNHVFNSEGSTIDHNTGYGITEINGANDNHILGAGAMVHNNTLGNIAISEYSLASNITQWAQEVNYTANRAANLDLLSSTTFGVSALNNDLDILLERLSVSRAENLEDLDTTITSVHAAIEDVQSTLDLMDSDVDNIWAQTVFKEGKFSPTGNVYHVNGIDGNDGNPGTKAQPFLTIGRGITECVSGRHDTVIVYGKSTPYNEQLFIDKNFIFIKGVGLETQLIPTSPTAETIIVSGATGVLIQGFYKIQNSNYNTVKILNSDGVTFRHGKLYGSDIPGIDIAHIEESKNVTFGELNGNIIFHIEHAGRHGIYLKSTTAKGYLSAHNCHIHECGGSGIYLEGNTKEGHITHNMIMNNAGYGIHIEGDGNVISQNIFGHNTLGYVDDQGTNSDVSNNEQWAKQETLVNYIKKALVNLKEKLVNF